MPTNQETDTQLESLSVDSQADNAITEMVALWRADEAIWTDLAAVYVKSDRERG